MLAEPLERLAYGVDGSLSSSNAWLLSSNTNDFQAQGVAPGHVVRMPERGKAKLAGSPKGLYAVDGVVSANQLRLRPVGKVSGTGWPPQPAGTGGLEFAIDAADSQVLDASRSIDMRLRTDPAALATYPSDVVTPDDYRQLAVWYTLAVLYRAAWREADQARDTWLAKSREYAKLADDYFAEVMARVISLFGPPAGLPIVGQIKAQYGWALGTPGLEPAILNRDGTVTMPYPWTLGNSFWPVGWYG